MQRQLASVQGQLPTDPNQAITPITSKLDPNALPIMQVALISDTLSNTELYSIANDTLSPQLQQVRGVSQVAVVGGQPQEAQVLVDPNKLAGYAISLAALQNALAAENTAVPAGTLTQDPNTYNLRVSNLAVQSQDLGRITIGGTPDAPVRVSDRPPSSWLDGTRLRLPASTDTTAYSSVSAPRPAPTLPTCRTGSTVCSPSCSPSCRQALNWSRCRTAARSSEVP